MKQGRLWGVLIGLLVSAAPAMAADQTLEALIKRVEALEKRLDALEQKPAQVIIKQDELPPLQNPGNATEPENWARLTLGMSYVEVEELLGKPLSIRKGGVEYWYYSKGKLDGPFVKFLFNKVHSWRGLE